MKALNFNETQTAVALCMKADVVPFIFGHQGMCKSASIKQLVDHINNGRKKSFNLIDLRLSQIECIDLRGLMKIEDGITKYYPPSYLAPMLEKTWEGIAILHFRRISLKTVTVFVRSGSYVIGIIPLRYTP